MTARVISSISQSWLDSPFIFQFPAIEGRILSFPIESTVALPNHHSIRENAKLSSR